MEPIGPVNCWQESSFSYGILQLLFSLSEFLIHPYIYCLTGLGSPFLPVTPELQHPWKLRLKKIFIVPLYAVLMAIFFLPMLIGFCLKNILHHYKRPYCLVLKKAPKNYVPSGSRYTIATANLCLLPELMSRYNNLKNTAQRACQIGERIVIDQMHYTGMMETVLQNSFHLQNGGMMDRNGNQNRVRTRNMTRQAMNSPYLMQNGPQIAREIKIDVLSHFTQTNFLFLQETFDRQCTRRLIAELEKVYPYIVHDVGLSGPKRNLYGLNSGLMFASKHEILDIQFQPFSKKCGFCKITGKGLLMAKVK